MSTLSTYCSDADLMPIKTGIRTFIRLTGMIHDEHQYRWFADEADAVSWLNSIKRAISLSERMHGAQKYQGQPFDVIRQIREDLAAWMLTGETENKTVANRKRFSPLFYLVIEPTIDLLSKFEHAHILEFGHTFVNEVIEWVNASDAYGTYDDALIAQAMTRKLIADREEATKAIRAQRKSKKKKVETNFFDIDAEVVEEEPEEA